MILQSPLYFAWSHCILVPKKVHLWWSRRGILGCDRSRWVNVLCLKRWHGVRHHTQTVQYVQTKRDTFTTLLKSAHKESETVQKNCLQREVKKILQDNFVAPWVTFLEKLEKRHPQLLLSGVINVCLRMNYFIIFISVLLKK